MTPAERAARGEAVAMLRILTEIKIQLAQGTDHANQIARLGKAVEALTREIKTPAAELRQLLARIEGELEAAKASFRPDRFDGRN